MTGPRRTDEAAPAPGTEAPAPDGGREASSAAADPDTARLWAALRDVRDPEFPVSVVDLGLIYGISRSGARVEVELTFTATACPCMDFIKEDVRERLLLEPDVDEVEIEVVWDPPWTVDRMTEECRRILRRHGVAA